MKTNNFDPITIVRAQNGVVVEKVVGRGECYPSGSAFVFGDTQGLFAHLKKVIQKEGE